MSFELAQPPSDGISNVTFSPNNNSLLVSSWDCGVRIYDVPTNCVRDQYRHESPVLDCSWIDNEKVVSGSLDKILKSHNLVTGDEEVISAHTEAIRCVEYSNELSGFLSPHFTFTNWKNEDSVITGSWDKTLKIWDLGAENKCQTTIQMPGKVYTMDLKGSKLVVGTSERHVEIYDVRNLSVPEQRRESALKYQTRCIRCFPDGEGFAVSSTEGRVAIEYFDPDPEVQKLKYAFKCHRAMKEQAGQTSKVEHVYPVNVIEFHPTYGTFATGGGDGRVNIWDGKNKKRICQFPSYATSISSIAFDSTGTQIAVAVSYTFEEGEKDHPPDSIWIRSVSDAEVQPKVRPQ